VGRRQEFHSLVIADGLDVYPGGLGEFSDSHDMVVDLIPYYRV
jgi:hypothetical protein